ncbi:Glycoside hydrolase, subgroup, catalytic core [Cordyceps fumosorosea ARSEF 2679]|uniref:chitinase n=1 Tax=Cordyceps fumosorosea (strain ARSEF 2679) TaxID=1081104 RepID=A0A167SUM3_CORFA|nr:Glycoside hydrolase, subgroup, catalytic core [Cordyceps fumosorosea ARSEF 2679]OAA59939.1 Glycoside hydrolase, subgroup, catalytic core [Cordyceps fumosorosea ARSEF 2679]
MRRATGSAALALSAIVSLAAAVTESYSGQYPDLCPRACEEAGPAPGNWTKVHHLDELSSCTKDLVFDLNVHNSVDDPTTILTIRACTSTGHETFDTESQFISQDESSANSTQNALVISNDCGAKTTKSYLTPRVGGPITSGSSFNTTDIPSAVGKLKSFMEKGAQCGKSILFAKSGNAVVGLYSGSQISKSSVPSLLDEFSKKLEHGSYSMEICSDKQSSDTFGAAAGEFKSLATVQAAVKGWVDGECLGQGSDVAPIELEVFVSTVGGNSTGASNSTMTSRASSMRLPRGDCKTQQVQEHDSCAAVASRCGISVSDLQKYNGGASDFCNKLMPKQHVCCGPGTLPDFRPQPQPDGTCHTYKINPDETCYLIADANYLKADDIEGFNKNTWGWSGCEHLQPDQIICLSKGDPPMPAPIADATCGPQVPGTKKPTDGTKLADLNPCPLNACCDVWGFCGTTDEFCTATPSDTGAPGTAKPGTNGCISNCGRKLVNNDKAPDEFRRVGYYEAFGRNRDCLNMEVTAVDTDKYTHIHFAFATVTSAFAVDISDSKDQFDKFVKMDKIKKVLSFGGWDFSTKPETFQRFRDATKPGNRDAFIASLVDFVGHNAIDGLDFDWEYPGAPDIPDIPPGDKGEGDNYLDFLKALKAKMPSGKTISIALPASYWYLKQYPVKKMADVVDYFIYMTYDLHGQWDVGNKYATLNCPSGNCLRSHVNKTETMDSLILITKAGVESRKIVVGVSSYGRSFRMQDPSCSGPLCFYTGTRDHSEAYKGRCTVTSGYISNAEMAEIVELQSYSTVKQYYDKDSDSNVLEYGDGNAIDWVAYMDDETKASRSDWVKGLNFAGTSDWAADLNSFDGDDFSDAGMPDVPTTDLDNIDCDPDLNPGNMKDLSDKADSLPVRCQSLFALDILMNALDDSLSLFNVNSKDYDDKFGYYEQWVKDGIDDRLREFLNFRKDVKDAPGLDFFDCKYTWGRKTDTTSCTGMPHFWDYNDVSWTVEFILKDEKGFYDSLVENTGVDKDWIKFGTRDDGYDCADPGIDEPRRPGGGVSPPCRRIKHTYQNFPMKKSDSDIHVGNPKAIIEASMSNITALGDSLLAGYGSVGFGVYSEGNPDASEIDAVVAYAMPVFQLQQAVESMKDIKDIGEKAKEEKRKQLILTILTFVFMALPFVGEALGPIVGSAAALARIALIVSEVGNAAVTIADIVGDPTSAPFAILGLIVGVGGGTGKVTKAEGLGKAAAARAIMKDGDLAKFPARFRELDSQVQKIVSKTKDKVCHLKF